MDAGLDSSGKINGPLCVVALAAVASSTAVDEGLALIRRVHRLPVNYEFQSHRCTDAMRLKVLHVGLDAELRVAALILEQDVLGSAKGAGIPPGQWIPKMGLSACAAAFASIPVRRLRADTEFQGDRTSRRFETEAARLHRSFWPGFRLDVRCRDSRGSALIQVADVVAYSVARCYRNAESSGETRRLVERLRTESPAVLENLDNWWEW